MRPCRLSDLEFSQSVLLGCCFDTCVNRGEDDRVCWVVPSAFGAPLVEEVPGFGLFAEELVLGADVACGGFVTTGALRDLNFLILASTSALSTVGSGD